MLKSSVKKWLCLNPRDEKPPKVIVVTGGSYGLGKALIDYYATYSSDIIVVGLCTRFSVLEDIKSNLPLDARNRFYPILCDVSLDEQVKRAFKWIELEFHRVDVLINSATEAFNTQILIDNLEIDNMMDLRKTLNVNVLASAYCSREAFNINKKYNVQGHIILINSTIAGHTVPRIPNISFNMYPPSKFAITAMTENIRQEFYINNKKMKVTSVSLDFFDSDKLCTAYLDYAETRCYTIKTEIIVRAINYCVQTPPHVQIHELTIKAHEHSR